MLWKIVGVLLGLWTLGGLLDMGDVIHVLLVVAAILVMGNMVRDIGQREQVG